MGLRFRFACLIGLISLLVLTSFSALIYHQVSENAFKGAESYLKELTRHEWEHLDLPSHQNSSHQETQHYRNVYLQIWKNGKIVYDSFPVGKGVSRQDGLDLKEKKLFHSIEGLHEDQVYRIWAYYDVSLILEYLSLIQRTLILGCLVALFLMIPLSWMTAKLLLRPFARLASETSTLTAQELSFRIKEGTVLDEYGILVKNFNLLFDRLEKSFKKVRNFAVNASHEMRTPLAVIVSQLDRVLRSPPKDVESCLSVCQKTLQSALQLRNITNHLFLLSEAERLGDEELGKPFEVNQVIETALSHLQEAYQEGGKSLQWQKNSEGLSWGGNSSLFFSIVTNLLENAFKYSKEKIVIRCFQEKNQLAFVVEDDGPGISLEARNRVFEPFYKEHPNKQGSNSSHGLGLAIVEACVRALKGQITLGESELGGLFVKVLVPS